MNMSEFVRKFNFRKEGEMLIGIEREGFILDSDNRIVPLAGKVLERLKDNSRFGYELSACQLEDRVGPCNLGDLRRRLLENEAEIKKVEDDLNFSRLYCDVAPADMPLDIYPDPTGRYQKIARNIPDRILRAACRVAGVHVHVGMPDHGTALAVYNKVIGSLDYLCAIGDLSGGERLSLYKIMAPNFKPSRYGNWKEFYESAVANGFAIDPRKCWHLIRISVHGTIEFRMFGSTSDLSQILNWGKICHDLCSDALGD